LTKRQQAGGEFLRPTKTVQAMAVVAVVILGPWFGVGDVVASSQDAEGRLTFAARQAGAWLVTYDVAAFGAPFPLLLSLGADGLVSETDAPGKFRSDLVY
jgi:hypothetical protein